MNTYNQIAAYIASQDYFLNPVCESATNAYVNFVAANTRLPWREAWNLAQAMIAACF